MILIIDLLSPTATALLVESLGDCEQVLSLDSREMSPLRSSSQLSHFRYPSRGGSLVGEARAPRGSLSALGGSGEAPGQRCWALRYLCCLPSSSVGPFS